MFTWKFDVKKSDRYLILSAEHMHILNHMIGDLNEAYNYCTECRDFLLCKFLLRSYKAILSTWSFYEYTLGLNVLRDWEGIFMKGGEDDATI